jgi:hypothetical protein
MRIIAAFLCLFAFVAQGQNDIFNLDNFQVNGFFGVRMNNALGTAKSEWKNDSEDALEVLGESFTYESDYMPKEGLHIGINLGFGYTANTSFGTGFIFTQKGYRHNTLTEYEDLEYQYDYKETQGLKYTVNALEIPLWLNYQMNDLWTVEGGFVCGINLKNSLKITEVNKRDVWINGEKDEEWSLAKSKNKQNAPALNKAINTGIYLEARREFMDYFYVFGRTQFDSGYMNNGYGNLNNLSLTIGAHYQIIR